MEVILVSGNSGGGKSVTLKILEDLGYYCVDNLLVNLIPTLTKNLMNQSSYNKIAISLDIRNLLTSNYESVDIQDLIKELNLTGCDYKIIFLYCEPDIIVRRYADTRRKHPLLTFKHDITLEQAIEAENNILSTIKNISHTVINTSNLTVHQLSNEIQLKVAEQEKTKFDLIFKSFGFKYGMPLSSDFVFDARFLPNPYWLPELRSFNGLDQQIINFFEQQPEIEEYINNIVKFLDNTIDKIKNNNRLYLTISIGCTGGKHRSVYITERLKSIYANKYNTLSFHQSLIEHHGKK